MAHVRKLIRDNVKTTLTGLTTTGNNVYQTRVYPLAEDKLPGIAIYSSEESTLFGSMNPPRTQIRTLTLAVEIYVKAVDNYDDTLDQICLEIEESLYADLTRGGYAKDTQVLRFSSDFSGDGDQPVAYGTLEVSVDYATAENDLETSV
jgi:hypothetical protein